MNRLLALLIFSLVFAAPSAAKASQLDSFGMGAERPGSVAPVGVIDTGFNPSYFDNVTVTGPASSNDADHGTWMTAAIVDPLWGTAPGAAVHAYSCELNGGIDIDCAASAIQGLLDEGRVRVISMSFVYSGTVPADVRSRWTALAQRAADQGVVLVASSLPGASFPADIAGIVKVGTQTAPAIADVRAPGSGVITDPGCRCDSEAEGVSYSAAWVSGIASRLIGEGASAADVKAQLTGGHMANLPALRSALHLATAQVPVDHVQPVTLPRLSHVAAIWRGGRLTVRWKGGARSAVIVAGARRLHTTARRVSVRLRVRPRVVTLRSGAQTLHVRVRVR
jgi:hypothetical protein